MKFEATAKVIIVTLACFLVSILSFGSSVPQRSAPCKSSAEIHPTLTATRDVEASNEVSDFMNGIQAKCPEGYNVTDPKHTLHANMSYKDTFNAVSQLICVVAK